MQEGRSELAITVEIDISLSVLILSHFCAKTKIKADDTKLGFLYLLDTTSCINYQKNPAWVD